MRALMLLVLAMGLPRQAAAQDVEALFLSGKYKEVVDAVSQTANPEPSTIYMAAEASQKLSNAAKTRELLGRLTSRPAADPWHLIGRSALAVEGGDLDAALGAANEVTKSAPEVWQAHYQKGLVLARRQEFAGAAAAFDAATSANPRAAYGYYYAGLAHYRAKRVDKMALNFERFLKLAPEAPERREVESIMRTVRGK